MLFGAAFILGAVLLGCLGFFLANKVSKKKQVKKIKSFWEGKSSRQNIKKEE